ncbi:solute carrier family 23 member 1-like isoform X2 [Mercenaria mercenaria]|uniref:solute carrier family 23 member 1-like isoform X2 n=1 Tax=Mercenaria mercenaria TaxID=6596 RepID=UPI00234EC5C5|nr:solute carrier family 23 member 1-like isoform X2 [Mercenaria mercenaria]
MLDASNSKDVDNVETVANNNMEKHEDTIQLKDAGTTNGDTCPEKQRETLVQTDFEEEKLFHYDVFENPPIFLAIVFAMQQVLMSLSRSLSTALLVADIVCARTDENFKARLLSTTLFISGITTFLQNTVGVRLPLYQGPAMTYLVPLLAMSSLPEWRCPDLTFQDTPDIANTTGLPTISNASDSMAYDQASVLDKVQRLEGSLMIAGALHMLVGLTGIVGLLINFIGPVTIVPALTVIGIYIYKATTKFAKTQWGVSMLTVCLAMVLSFYLRMKKTPIPVWSPGRGFRIVLISCIVGWLVSAILTACDVIPNDPLSDSYYARTDSRLEVIGETSWFIFPYPGQFGPPGFDTGALITFLMGTLSSVIDSIGDYYACAKVCDAPPPPKHAANRGIAIEGFMSFIGGWSGASHATSTFGGNIGAIGITRVASLRVFQLVGIIFTVFGVIGKIGAIFVTIPYSVIGGMMMINFGVLIGVMLSNLQFIDLSSTRNLGIIGMSILMAMMLPYWVEITPNAIQTGVPTLDSVFTMFLANPAFVAFVLACFMDNTMPGTEEERGLSAWKASMGVEKETNISEKSTKDEIRLRKLRKTIYTVPFSKQLVKRFKCLRFLPFYPK